MNRKLAASAAIIAAVLLSACSSDEPPTASDIKEACQEGRIATMAADADPADLGSDWPREFEYIELKDGSYEATWIEGVGSYELKFKCSVRWEDGEATDVSVDF